MHSNTTPVEQLSYQGHPGITMSDHRPVSADFAISVCGMNPRFPASQTFTLRPSSTTQCDVMDVSEYEVTVRKLYRQVMYMEEEETPPKITLAPTSIDFGTVGYLKSVTKTLEVTNTGKVWSATHSPDDYV
jgi:phosphatidylinositol-bisphosphatase